MPTTEVLRAELLPGSNIGDPENDAGQVFKDAVDTLSKQSGAGQIYFGMRKENANILQLFVEWDSLQSHHDFMASDVYSAFTKRFFSMTTGALSLVHVDFKPDGGLAKALTAPLTSVATFNFEGGTPPSDYESSAHKFLDIVTASNIPGERGHAIGLTVEEVESEGVKGRSAVLVVGWDSVEAFEQFHASEIFKENAKYVSKGVSKRETHFVQFMNAIPA